MAAAVVRRLLYSIVVIVGVVAVVFVITRLIGDPARLILPLDASVEQYERMREQMGLNESIPQQFLTFLNDAVRGDFGESLWQRKPAMDIVLERLPATFALSLAGLGLALLVALPLGILAAVRPGSVIDRIAQAISLLGVSVPNFWIGMMLIVVFSVGLGWFPSSGSGGVEHLVLPALAVAALSGGRLTQIVRAGMIEELDKPYVLTARSKGVSEFRIVSRHALRSAAIPIITLAGWEFAYMLAGYSVSVEVVFAWPGTGQLTMQAMERQDLPLIQACVFVVAVAVVALNLLTDLAYLAIDPRIRDSV